MGNRRAGRIGHGLRCTAALGAIALSLCAASAVHAQAQGENPEAQEDGLADILVTAQRRTERLQDVPVSVTAVTGEQLDRLQITDMISLQKAVPGLAPQPGFIPSEIRIGLRGITELTPVISIDPAVGLYIDGVYYQARGGANPALTAAIPGLPARASAMRMRQSFPGCSWRSISTARSVPGPGYSRRQD